MGCPWGRPDLVSRLEFYYAVGDGTRRIFTLADGVEGYDNALPHPRCVTLTSVYVNGVLQPDETYVLREGALEFISNDAPRASVPIVAQFVRLRLKGGEINR